MPDHRLAALLSGLAVCLAGPVAAEDAVQGAHGLTLPGSFTGVLPCADCPGIVHQLDLWPEGGYALRQEYLERDTVVQALGRWHVDPARRALVLDGDDTADWQILGNGQLRLMDREGQPIESDLPYGLERGPLEPFDLALPMTGEFVYFADAGLFTECRTGQRYPVVMEGAYLELERAYLEARVAPMAPLLVRIDGRIALAEQMEGPQRRSVTVEGLHHVTPGGACATGRVDADLVDTFWRIMEIGDDDLPEGLLGREPHLLLSRADGARFVATVGCNTLLGGFELEGEALAFGAAASTMMACPPEQEGLEAALGEALAATAGFDSDGHRLRLRDADGRVLARLQAAHTPHR